MTSVIVNRRVDTEYRDALANMLNHLGYDDEDEIIADDYDAVEEFCSDLPKNIAYRLLNLVPEADEEDEKIVYEDDEFCDEPEALVKIPLVPVEIELTTTVEE